MKNYPLEKYHFYVHGNRVIAVSTYAGKAVRGVAVCANDDTFDIEKGKQLAAARCNAKIAKKRLARAEAKIREACEDAKKADAHLERMGVYYSDSLQALWEAMRNIESLKSNI